MDQQQRPEKPRQPNKIVIDGYSKAGKIRLESRDFAAIATYSEEKNQVTVEVDLLKNIKGDPADRGFDWKFHGRVFLFIFLSYASLAGLMVAFTIDNPVWSNALALFSIIVFVLAACKMIVVLVKDAIKVVRGFTNMKKIAPWHGAEHKVIESYWATGTTDLEAAKRTSPVSDHCGGRYAVLLLALIVAVISMTVALVSDSVFAVRTVGFSIAGATLVMSLFHKKTMKVAVFLSRKLQQHWTTKEPGEKELWTAHCAIVELLKTEERSENFEDFRKYSVTYDRRP